MSNEADAVDGGAASDAAGDDPNGSTGDATVPQVDLSLRELSVSVTGRSDDELESVEESALSLMEELVEQTEALEDDRDEYGLS